MILTKVRDVTVYTYFSILAMIITTYIAKNQSLSLAHQRTQRTRRESVKRYADGLRHRTTGSVACADESVKQA